MDALPDFTKRERKELHRSAREAAHIDAARQVRMRRIGLWTLAAIAVAAAIFGVIRLASAPSPSNSGVLSSAVSPSDWTSGNPNAKVLLVEYADFQCPACGAYYPVVKRVTTELKDKVRFVYRNFPLPQLHANADLAARAAEAAGKQGKFWEMHDQLFEHQSDWSDQGDAASTFAGYANSLGLNVDQFKRDIDSAAVRDKIAGDVASGTKSNVQGTPTFFLNGNQIDNPSGYDSFRSILDAAVSAAH